MSTWLFRLAFVLVMIAGPTLYVSTVIEDQDAFVAVANRVVDQPEVRRAIASKVTEVSFEAIGAEETVAELLPEGARRFSVPLTRVLSERLTDAAFALLDTDAAADARNSALRELHRQVTTDNDEVVVDLRAVLVRTSREVGGPAVGAGVAELVSDTDTGRFTLAEAGSVKSDLLPVVRGAKSLWAWIGLAALAVLATAILLSPDRRRGLVICGVVMAAAAVVSTLLVAVVLFVVYSSMTQTSPIGHAVVEVVAADFAEQQRGAVVNGLALAAIGMLLGNRPTVVALRRVPADLWYRRPGALDAVGSLIRDNPPIARVVVWAAGLFTVLAWPAPTWRVLITILSLTFAMRTFIWLATATGPRAERLRRLLGITDVGIEVTHPASSRLRVNLGVATVVVFVLWPHWSRASLASFFVVAAAVQTVIDLPAARRIARSNADTGPEPLSTAPSSGSMFGVRRRYVLAGVVGVAVLAAGTLTTAASVERADVATGCNGHVDLCDRRIDEIVLAGSHNSMSSSDLGWELAVQTGDMVTQLDHGVRALLIDAHYWDHDGTVEGDRDPAVRLLIEAALSDDRPRPGTWLCHGYCALGATDLTGALTDIDLWLEARPREVVLILVQDEIDVGDLASAFDDSGLLERTHVHRAGTPFPTLRELIDADERVLVYAENAGEPDTWLQNAFADTFSETPFTFAVRSEFSCAPNRGGSDNPLLLINHWLTTGIPVREAAAAVNRREILLERVRECEADRGRLPTILAADFVQDGHLIEVVAQLNRVVD